MAINPTLLGKVGKGLQLAGTAAQFVPGIGTAAGIGLVLFFDWTR